MFNSIYSGRRVFLTGHSGFKGSQLTEFLLRLNAEVCGYSLPPNTSPSLFELLKQPVTSIWGDIREADKLKKAIRSFRPEIVFHLAAQPLVRASYADPAETFEVNAMGTCRVLEACRDCDSIRAVVVISSDKCYENKERRRGYRETDPLGGFDPYSASKGCAEIIVSSYRRSFFSPAEFGRKHQVLLASARAGNVIGGGDWAADRLLPDLFRAAAAGETAPIRCPAAVRPWQHVLEPLSGYLLLGRNLLEKRKFAAAAWNFGPAAADAVSVGEVAERLRKNWRKIRFRAETRPEQPHEAKLLELDCSRAAKKLRWAPVLALDEALKLTADWYRDYYEKGQVNTAADLERYLALAAERGAIWTMPQP